MEALRPRDRAPAADLWALGTLGLFLLAGSFPAPGEEPGRLPEIPEPPSSWTPEERDALRELVRLLRDLRHPEPSARGQIEALAPRLFGLAVRLGGPDLAGRIAASWLRAPLPPRLAPATEALAREPAAGSPTPRASRPTRPLRRALAAGALLSTLGLGGGVAWWLGTSKAAPPRPELVNAAAHRGKAARDGGPKASCDIGSLLLPTQARFLCPDERFDRHRSRWQARFESPDVKEISLRVLNGPDVWRLANPPPGGGVKLELSPNRYDVHVLHANGKSDDDELVLAPGSNESYSAAEYTNQAPARSPAEAAASWRSQWKEAKLAARKDPARVVRIDRTLRDFHAPLQLVPEGPRTAVNVVEATAHGAGRLTWNVNDHPCDGPAMPLAQEPIDPGHPLSLYSDMSLWACPRRASERGPFTVHLAGWREEPIGGVSE